MKGVHMIKRSLSVVVDMGVQAIRVVAVLLVLTNVAPAQAPSVSSPPGFEIADVHPSPTLRGYVQSFGGIVRDGRYINRETTMLDLIKAAYGVSDDDISGGPGWVSSDLFDVIAKVPNDTTPETANLMLRSLLSERFGLVVRRDTRPVPRYVLTIGRNGSN
jgi:uncharacterized protein (TIGR03435 family)